LPWKLTGSNNEKVFIPIVIDITNRSRTVLNICQSSIRRRKLARTISQIQD